MKKLYLHKLYTPQDIAKILQRKEEEIIALLERERTKGVLGRKIMGFWYVRGKQVIEIQKLLKGDKRDDQIEIRGKMVGRADGKRIKKK